MLDCVLISQDDAFRRQVTELVGRAESNVHLALDLSSSAEELAREAVARVVAASPRLAFVDLGESTLGLRVVRALSEEAPDLTILATGPALAADVLLDVMRAGATEYLPRPLGAEDVAQAFQRLRRRVATSGIPADAHGRVITVFSSKGGTGVTTLAANLAVLIARRTSVPTLLLDLNPGFGTAELNLGLQPRYSYLDVIHNFHRIDGELLESYLEDHDSGVSFLAAPSIEEEGGGATPEEFLNLLRLCRRHFAYVVVDAGSRIRDLTIQALRDSDDLLMVATPEIPTLRNLKRAQNHLLMRGLNGAAPPKVVLNHAREGTGVTEREIQEVLGDPVFATVERDEEAVLRSQNTGEPIGDRGRSRYARSLSRLGDRLLGTHRPRGGGRLSFLKSLRTSSSDK